MPIPELAITTNDPPDWDSHPSDLLCPLCRYNLRYLTTARCPECGFIFQWQELLDTERDKHRYIFEHGRGRNFKSFWKTWWRTAQPGRFWTDLNPAQPVVLFRLILYWAISAVIVALFLSTPTISEMIQTTRQNTAARAALIPVPNQPGIYSFGVSSHLSQADVDWIWPMPWKRRFWVLQFLANNSSATGLGWALIFIVWPWITLLALLVFRISMRQAKILRVHLLRTAIYSCDFGFLLGLGLIGVVSLDTRLSTGWDLVLGAILCSLITTWRLTIAFQKYLRVHLPFATVLASQIIAVLVIFLLLIQIADFGRRV